MERLLHNTCIHAATSGSSAALPSNRSVSDVMCARKTLVLPPDGRCPSNLAGEFEKLLVVVPFSPEFADDPEKTQELRDSKGLKEWLTGDSGGDFCCLIIVSMSMC